MRRVQITLLGMMPVAVVVYFIWGALLGARFDEILEEFHERGVPRWEEIAARTYPDEENGAPLLTEAVRIFEEVEEVTLERDQAAGGDRFELTPDFEIEPPSEDDRRVWAEALPDLEPCFALIERAARRPTLAPEASPDPFGGGTMTDGLTLAMTTARLLRARAYHDSATTAHCAELLLTFAQAVRAAGIDAPMMRHVFRQRAAGILRSGIARGSIGNPAAVDRLRSSLEAWDPLDDARLEWRCINVLWAWTLAELRAGRTPDTIIVGSLGIMRKMGGVTNPDEAWWTLPWAPPSRWYARPLMLRTGIEILEARLVDIDLEFTPTLLRERAGRDCPANLPLPVSLRELCHRRLSILALRILEHRRTKGALPESLDALGIDTASEDRHDPYTGKALRFDTTSRDLEISSAGPNSLGDLGAGPRRELREDMGLIWTIPR